VCSRCEGKVAVVVSGEGKAGVRVGGAVQESSVGSEKKKNPEDGRADRAGDPERKCTRKPVEYSSMKQQCAQRAIRTGRIGG